tara:strand:+ start:2146 stop:3165 length:1020 start_codon:yes stop_codon:yes gene_type:complete
MIIMTRDEIKQSIIDYRKDTGQRDLKNSSLLQYIQNFSKLQNETEPDEELNLNFVLNEDKVDQKLSSYSLTTRRNYYNCIIIILESNKKKFNVTEGNTMYNVDDIIKSFIVKRDKLNDTYNETNKTHKYTGNQADNSVTKDDILIMLKKIKKEISGKELFKQTKDTMGNYNYALLMYYVCVSIHVNAPLRNDLAFLKVYNYRKMPSLLPDNYMVVNKDNISIILNDYKTNRDNKTATITISDKPTINIIKKYIKLNGGFGEYLLKNNDGTPLSKNGLSHLFARYSDHYLKKKVSTTLLRKCFYTDKYGHIIDTIIAMDKDAENNLHSLSTALNVYTKST